MNVIRIATRGSDLALWQARDLQHKLSTAGCQSELVILKTKGDNIQHLSFDKIEGKGFFTKEIEDALISNDADIAVHSLKDLPTEATEGLILAGLSERQDVADMLIASKQKHDPTQALRIASDSIIGSSSIRRKMQLLTLDPHVNVQPIRGNVPGRLAKINNGVVDAVILAAAGLNRLQLDLSGYYILRLSPEEFVPAPGQGAIAYQCRTDDLLTRKILNKIHNRSTAATTNVERRVLQLLGGGCQTPIGVYCHQDAQASYHCYAFKAATDGTQTRKIMYSSTTTAGMAEAVTEQLSR